MRDAVVVGAGLAGLAATIRAADAGLRVTLIAKGVGGIQLGTGTVDILGYGPDPIDKPVDALAAHVASRPTHPYAHIAPDQVGACVAWLRDTVGPDALIGDETRNVRIPTGVGALRPTCLFPPSMRAGIPRAGARYAIVGLQRLKDFYPDLVAENLTRQAGPDSQPIKARALSVDYVVRDGEIDSTGTNHARSLDREENRARLADTIRPLLQDGETVGLPAVLGLDNASAWRDLADKLGHPVFEIPIQPPSVPGMRLNAQLTRLASEKARVILGAPISTVHAAHGRVKAIEYASAGRATRIETRSLILAAGGFESGALDMDSYGTVRETICGLPVMGATGQLLHADFWGDDQPLFLSGLAVDDSMRVVDADGEPVYANLYAAGGNLAGATRWREKSGEGIALASALTAVDAIVEELK
ncbi:glycerol-3-phosphate dehydrogenase [Schaalia meyeri]|uniref:Glycerol-3-phosphate dehydrogenase subunit GlpB n=1 Tax=Schaalia meyeri TaxID=52773 RepID=A0AAP9Y8X6_9ACTO|nr:glycerol-3-phosphate dehydrogenase subunit GlpB [Schaalia meyeri]AKU64761.1 glycerol-3-phosphate dehydrogenase [Schaalia meyeri]OFQ24472.1 anaerobic glycerol-3-phosphate dehydrogenase subunit B [Actinomyces sp. HMSC062G12]QQC44572.1 glycerol-3-phosphate dehydrogenase subunit GlpB [Schaalia meyeri]SDR64576.1 glycerol 3-phosphate dehydrogenase (quinone) subunit B [Schaalia meyeri]